MKERLKALLKAWTTCSGREGRRILLLIPLLVLIALLFLWYKLHYPACFQKVM